MDLTQDSHYLLSEQRRELAAAEAAESDLDFAFRLQLQEALAASLAMQPSSSSSAAAMQEEPMVVDDHGGALSAAALQREELSRAELEMRDREQSEMEMRKTRDAWLGDSNLGLCAWKDNCWKRPISLIDLSILRN